MKKGILLVFAALAVLSLGLSSCKKDKEGEKVGDVKLVVEPKGGLTVLVGETATLTIKTSPKGATYTCVSEDPTIATVDQAGVVTGVAKGNTSITVTAGSASQKVEVKVMGAGDYDQSHIVGNNLPADASDEVRAMFAPFYIPVFDQMKEQEQMVKAANEQYGWEFFLYTGEQEYLNKSIYTCAAPQNEDGTAWADQRIISQLVYLHDKALTGNEQMEIYFKAVEGVTIFDEDPIIFEDNLTDEQKQNMNILMTILATYGFDDSFGGLQLTNKQGQVTAVGLGSYNKHLEEEYYAYLLSEQTEDGRYDIHGSIIPASLLTSPSSATEMAKIQLPEAQTLQTARMVRAN